MTEESAVKVCVRVRPLFAREESTSENAEPIHLFWKCDDKSIHQIDDGTSTRSFSFDRVFAAEETTHQLYQDIAKPLVVSTVQGYNGTVFAYGQTSSGKTFTMMGRDHVPGVIPLAVEDVFQTIKNCPKKEFLLRVSYMEIYNETVSDLLVDSWKRKPLEVRETLNKNIYVADLTEELVTSPAQALSWIRKGEKNRHYGKTKMNERSSRSHTIFRMILESRERSDPASGENADGAIIVSHLNLVDLAGSERASQTGAEGTRFKEGCNINRSLFTLGQVIKKLTDESQKGFINYRDSKLTRILQNSLGGNAKTVIICTITPVTLEETLSTLQFASTAKKMKNDPHVTEVSDDGALLRRYRNEIADLKRRLQEVSSVTHTTATEREVLSQLIQEKDQLQREQQDRIRNLTKLLVTSSNLDPVRKMPKRRVTWGGKMLKLAQASACDGDAFESFSRKRKADRSCLSELGEEDEFDSQWEIPDEPSDELEMSQCPVTVHSFEESSKDFVSPGRMHELSSTVSGLKLQLEAEGQQKEDALAKVQKLDSIVSELAQQKLEAVAKVELLMIRVADLERQLEEQSHPSNSQPDKEMGREFAEAIQLCEALVSEKEMVAAERDYLKQELGMFIEQTENLEKDKAALSQELKEKREIDEFENLEHEFRREHEDELQGEISRLKKALELSELHCQELENKMAALSEDLRRKTELTEQLQSLNGKDLVQEVAKLRRSLDDAEGVSRDTKRDWAVLRSESIALEEMNATLTANYKKMEAQVNSLQFQLESERSRNKSVQSDLQKELNVAFEENTKLTTLLDGKVPKNLMDGVELERKVANLNKELAAAHKVEEALKAELAAFQTPPDTVDNLNKQVHELTEELGSIQNERDNLLSEILNVQAGLKASAQREQQLSQQCADGTQQLDSLRSELEHCAAERSQLMDAMEETASKLKEHEQHRAALEDKLKETQQLVKDLEEKLGDSEMSRTTEEEISKELQEQVNQLTHGLQCVRAEKDALLCDKDAGLQALAEMEQLLSAVTAERDHLSVEMAAETHRQKNLYEQEESEMLKPSQELQCVREQVDALPVTGAQGSTEEVEKLLSALASVSAERDQLKMDMQENVDMMIENQEELRTVLEKNHELKGRIKQLEAAQASNQDKSTRQLSAQLEELRTHLETLTEELGRVRAERDGLLAQRTDGSWSSSEEVDKLLCRVASLSEEKDQLQEILEGLRQEKNQLKAELEDRMEMVVQAQCGFNQTEILTSHLQAHEERMTQLQQEVTEAQCLIKSLEEQLQEQKQKNLDLGRLCEQKECDSQQQTKSLTEELEGTRAERDALVFEKETNSRRSTEEMEKLQCRVRSLSEETGQLQETLEGVRREKNQLRQELEDRMKLLTELNASLQTVSGEKNQLEQELQHSVNMTSTAQELVSSVEEELCRQKQMNSDLLKHSQETECTLGQQIQTLSEKLESIAVQRDSLLSAQSSTEEMQERMQRTVASLSEERDQLHGTVEKLRQEKGQIKAELENRMETLQSQMKTLKEKLESVESERDGLLSERRASSQTTTEAMERMQCRVASLSEERDQLQEALEGLRWDRDRLRAEQKLHQQEQLILQQQTEKGQQETGLRQEMRSEANATVSSLGEQLSRRDQCSATVKDTLSSRLQESTEQLEESFGKFPDFIDMCSKYNYASLKKTLQVQCALKMAQVIALPKPTQESYCVLFNILLSVQMQLTDTVENLQLRARIYRKQFEQLVKTDLAIFEEKRLQDLLLCRVQEPSYAVKHEDIYTVLEQRLTELLDKRQFYLQKMASILEKFSVNMTSFSSELSAEVRDRDGFSEQLRGVDSPSKMDSILSHELDHRAAVAHSRKMTLQGIKDEHNQIFEELRVLDAQAESQLMEERSKNATLLKALEGAPLKTEVSLLKDNQQLVLQLQQSEEKVKVLYTENKKLEEAQAKASSRVSNHKQATQLLQTELQDSRTQVEEKENMIQTLKSKLQELEKNASSSGVELKKRSDKIFKLEVELSSASDQHQQEIQRMKMVLNQKEDSLRDLKETLRRVQQEGEESFLTGKELHARLTSSRGLVVKSSVLLEKTKLEDEVKQLRLKVTKLESLVSSQQADINKWKYRAIKLKARDKRDAPSSPCTPTKRGLPMSRDAIILNSPRKLLDSPRKLLDSPKSSFFGVEQLSKNCPKQFFDNSSLGTIPQIHESDLPGVQKDTAEGSHGNELCWSSPKQDQMCKTQ